MNRKRLLSLLFIVTTVLSLQNSVHTRSIEYGDAALLFTVGNTSVVGSPVELWEPQKHLFHGAPANDARSRWVIDSPSGKTGIVKNGDVIQLRNGWKNNYSMYTQAGLAFGNVAPSGTLPTGGTPIKWTDDPYSSAQELTNRYWIVQIDGKATGANWDHTDLVQFKHQATNSYMIMSSVTIDVRRDNEYTGTDYRKALGTQPGSGTTFRVDQVENKDLTQPDSPASSTEPMPAPTGMEDNVWCITSTNDIFFREGITTAVPKGTSWSQITGLKAKELAVSPEGSVWAIDLSDQIFFRTGITQDNPKGSSWTQVSGLLNQIALGPNGQLWGKNSSNTLFVRTGITQAAPMGTTWEVVDQNIAQVAVGANGSIWALSTTGVTGGNEIKYRTGVTSSNFKGTGWQIVAGGLNHIAVGPNGQVWGKNTSAVIFGRTGVTSTDQIGTGWKDCGTGSSNIAVSVNNHCWTAQTNQSVVFSATADVNNMAWESASGVLTKIYAGGRPPAALPFDPTKHTHNPPAGTTFNDAWQLPEPNRGLIKFQAKGNDIYVDLSQLKAAQNNQTYKAIIGGWSNTQSAIQRLGGIEQLAAVGTDSTTNFHDYWMSIDGGLIKIGKGTEYDQNKFIELNDPSTIANIIYVGFGGWDLAVEFQNINIQPLPTAPVQTGATFSVAFGYYDFFGTALDITSIMTQKLQQDAMLDLPANLNTYFSQPATTGNPKVLLYGTISAASHQIYHLQPEGQGSYIGEITTAPVSQALTREVDPTTITLPSTFPPVYPPASMQVVNATYTTGSTQTDVTTQLKQNVQANGFPFAPNIKQLLGNADTNVNTLTITLRIENIISQGTNIDVTFRVTDNKPLFLYLLDYASFESIMLQPPQTAPPTPITPTPASFTISGAWYGVEGQSNPNVQTTLSQQLNADKYLNMPAGMAAYFGQDPFPGQKKQLAVSLSAKDALGTTQTYRLDFRSPEGFGSHLGEVLAMAVSETTTPDVDPTTKTLPDGFPSMIAPIPMQVIGATYPTQSNDVTAQIKQNLQQYGFIYFPDLQAELGAANDPAKDQLALYVRIKNPQNQSQNLIVVGTFHANKPVIFYPINYTTPGPMLQPPVTGPQLQEAITDRRGNKWALTSTPHPTQANDFELYFQPSGSTQWQQVPAAAKDIAAHPSLDQVWVTQSQQLGYKIHARTNITDSQQSGSGWQAVQGALKDISINSFGFFSGTGTDNQKYYSLTNNPTDPQWTLEPDLVTLQSDLDACNTQVKTLTNQITTLTGERDKALTDLNAAQQQITTLTNQVNTLTSERDKALTDLSTIQNQITILNNQINTLTNQINTLTSERDKALTDLATEQGLNSTLTNQITTLTNQVNVLTTERDNALANLNTAQQQVNTLTSERDQVLTDLTAAQNQATTLSNQVTALTNQVNTLTTERDNALNDLANANQQINTLTTEKNQLTSDLNNTLALLDNANKQISTLTNDLNAAIAQRDNLQNDLNTKQGELDQANQNISNLTTQLNQATSERDALQQDLNTKIQELAAANKQINDLNTQIGTLNKQLTDVTAERDNLQNNLTQTQGDLDSANQQITNLNNQINTLTQERDNLQNNLTQTQGDLDSANQQITNLNNQITTLTQERDNLQNNLTQTQGDLDSANQQITNLNNQITTSPKNVITSKTT
ncbi:MAG: hypothetical protein H6679_05125 [Epsilonproteobacteria bacterium]|nr:hypothetical protein [Campylobacterota bacterium]